MTESNSASQAGLRAPETDGISGGVLVCFCESPAAPVRSASLVYEDVHLVSLFVAGESDRAESPVQAGGFILEREMAFEIPDKFGSRADGRLKPDGC